MKYRRAQTATEYIVIISIVIVIALVVVYMMGGFPGISGSTSKKVSDYQLASGEKVGVSNYHFGNGYVLATLKSNYYDTLQIINVTIRNVSCTINNTNISGTNSSAFILTLNVGQSSTINCTGPFNISYNEEGTPSFLATYIDSITGATYTVSPNNNLNNGNPPFVCNNATEFQSGTGTTDDPFTICCWAHLNNMRNRLTSNYVLIDNLNSNTTGYSGVGDNWDPVGDSSFQFTGSFNGNSYTISNLVVNKSFQNKVGFFGYTTGNLTKIGLINVDITGASYVGGISGHLQSGTISNSFTSGTITGVSYVGGIVGYLDGGQITDSYSTATVNGGSS